MLTLAQLRAEHASVAFLSLLRAALLAGGAGWSAWLGGAIVLGSDAPVARRTLALLLYVAVVAIPAATWYFVLWRW